MAPYVILGHSRFQVMNEYLLFYEVVTVPIGRN